MVRAEGETRSFVALYNRQVKGGKGRKAALSHSSPGIAHGGSSRCSGGGGGGGGSWAGDHHAVDGARVGADVVRLLVLVGASAGITGRLVAGEDAARLLAFAGGSCEGKVVARAAGVTIRRVRAADPVRAAIDRADNVQHLAGRALQCPGHVALLAINVHLAATDGAGGGRSLAEGKEQQRGEKEKQGGKQGGRGALREGVLVGGHDGWNRGGVEAAPWSVGIVGKFRGDVWGE